LAPTPTLSTLSTEHHLTDDNSWDANQDANQDMDDMDETIIETIFVPQDGE